MVLTKDSPRKEVATYIGAHAGIGFCIGLVEGFLLGGIKTRNRRTEQLVKWALSVSFMTSLSAFAQVAVEKVDVIHDYQNDEDRAWTRRFIAPAVSLLPGLLLNRVGLTDQWKKDHAASRLPGAFTTVVSLAHDRRATTQFMNNLQQGNGDKVARVSLPRIGGIMTINYAILVATGLIVEYASK